MSSDSHDCGRRGVSSQSFEGRGRTRFLTPSILSKCRCHDRRSNDDDEQQSSHCRVDGRSSSVVSHHSRHADRLGSASRSSAINWAHCDVESRLTTRKTNKRRAKKRLDRKNARRWRQTSERAGGWRSASARAVAASERRVSGARARHRRSLVAEVVGCRRRCRRRVATRRRSRACGGERGLRPSSERTRTRTAS